MRIVTTALVALLLVAKPNAAVNLLGSADARVDFGDMSGVSSGLTAITIAWTVKTAGTLTGNRFVTRWGNGSGEQAFITQLTDTDEILCQVSNGGSGQYYGLKTTDSPVTTSTLLRVMCRINVSPKTSSIYVNGSARTTTLTVNNSPAQIINSNTSVQVGHETDETQDGLNGDYSEVAIWGSYVPDWVAEAYGRGISPRIYRSTGLLYAPLHNTSALQNEWASTNQGSNSSGSDAVHPTIYYPRGRQP